MVAMWGTYGYEMDLAELDDRQFAETQADIAYMKAHRNLLLYGESIRLLSPFEGDTAAWMVISSDQREAIVTAVRLNAHPNERRQRLHFPGHIPGHIPGGVAFRDMISRDWSMDSWLMGNGLWIRMPKQ